MFDISINPYNGAKEIQICSSVKFYNALDVKIEIGLKFYDR